MKIFGLFPLYLLLIGCGTLLQDEPEPVVEGDWIVLPMPEGVYVSTEAFRSETWEVVIAAMDWIETKVEMEEGKTIVYRWELVEDERTDALTRDSIYTEFHGHKPRIEGELGELMYYRKATGGNGEGVFTSPFTGIHGWFIDNTNDHDITVRVSVAGVFSRY